MTAGQVFPGWTARSAARGVEWPSVLLCIGVYGGFLLLTWFHGAIPVAVLVVLGASLLALQASMQHEFIHGHPTPWRKVNRALGFVPLNLWLPFESYRRTHLVHHCDERLTDPFDDPETQYWAAEEWAALGPLGRGLHPDSLDPRRPAGVRSGLEHRALSAQRGLGPVARRPDRAPDLDRPRLGLRRWSWSG